MINITKYKINMYGTAHSMKTLKTVCIKVKISRQLALSEEIINIMGRQMMLSIIKCNCN